MPAAEVEAGESPVPDPTPDPPTSADAPPSVPRKREWALPVAVAVAVVFASLSVLLGVVAVSLKSDRDSAADARADVELAAARFTEAFLTYDYRDPEATETAVLDLSAPPFTEEFEGAAPSLRVAFEQFQSSALPSIKDVFVADVRDEGTAVAIVVYDRVINGASGTLTERDAYLRLGLVQLEGRWLVNQVINLNLALSGSDSTLTPPVPQGDAPTPSG